MRAYLGQIDRSGLRRFFPEDAIPPDLVRQLARGWSSSSTIAFRAVLADEDADDLRLEVWSGTHSEAWSMLLGRAFEVIALGDAS